MWNSRVSIATAVGTLILASCCPRQFLHAGAVTVRSDMQGGTTPHSLSPNSAVTNPKLTPAHSHTSVADRVRCFVEPRKHCSTKLPF